MLDQLRTNNWIDSQTRVVFIDFNTYNPGVWCFYLMFAYSIIEHFRVLLFYQVNLYMVTRIAFEFPFTGGVRPTAVISPISIFRYSGQSATRNAMQAFLEIMLFCFVIGFILDVCE